MKRKLFSQKDGTTFREDIKDIAEDVKNFFHSLPAKIKKALPEATDFVDIIERIDLALQDGQPVDEVVDYVLNLTKTELDNNLYEFIKDKLHEISLSLHEILEDVNEQVATFSDIYEEGADLKRFTASNFLMEYSGLTLREANLAVEAAVYFYKG